ncbi:hypothetical protein PPL_00056 [Heterostelium album PN500]|uniref:Uncharacterized protein n=1 Tax=Heterostelium pallidum (strain ATCC 26659 / Pp 5 / PN500) TaxID=670386 RepID=D3BVQ5_HETP5|nr:hypothetical protein PPL_00056 [Heterostelium album PN500]EFA74558.1 hypothetical protein PPL_00056 [Heterostelium album PN500]|eukprot:XP_020426692.1 hypothetical protein PPL_00056 [Heterostelium album PN500]
MNSNIIYLLVLSLVYYVCTLDFVLSAECGSNAPPIAKYQQVFENYWRVDINYPDADGSLIDFGGLGRKTHAVPEKIYLISLYKRVVRLRFQVNDIYDVYFTVRDFNGVPCNHSLVSDTNTQSLPSIDIVQPVCLYTNATLTPFNNTYMNTPNFQVKCSTSPSSLYEMKAYTPTFQYKTSINGVHTITYGNGYSFPFQLQAQNSLVPIISYTTGVIGKKSNLTVLNANRFTSIKLFSSSGPEVIPTTPNNYPIVNNLLYSLVAVSDTCGTQIMDLQPEVDINVYSTVHSYNCQANTVDVSFDFGYNVSQSDYTINVAGSAYQVGNNLTLAQGTTYTISVTGINGLASTYSYSSPSLGSSVSYTIDSYPTCYSDGLVTFNYAGDISDIKVNNIQLTTKQIAVEYGTNYNVYPKCGGSFYINFNTVPLYSVDRTSGNCFGTASIVVQNYQIFSSIYLLDLNSNYTAVDGIFSNVYLSTNYKFVYKLSNNCTESEYYISLPMDNTGSETIEIHQQIVNQPDSCQDLISVNFQLEKGGVVLENFTQPNLMLGSTFNHYLKFGTCGTSLIVLTVDSLNILNTTTYKIIKPAVCKDSFALIQLESVDLLKLSSINIDLQPVNINKDDATYLVPTGKHLIDLNYQNDRGHCGTRLEIDIPFTRDVELSYNVINQDSTKCNQATGSIQFSNFADFSNLTLVNGTTSDNGSFNKLSTNYYTVQFNHSVCGVGQINNISVVTDGHVSIEEIYHPTCDRGMGYSDGVYQLNVFDRLGDRISNLSLNSTYGFDGLGIIAGQTKLDYKIKSQQFCSWGVQATYQLNEINVTFSDIKQYTTYPGSFNFNFSSYIRIDGPEVDGIGGSFVYPNHLDLSVYPNTVDTFTAFYNDYCKVMTSAPLNPVLNPDFGIKQIKKCGSMDTQIQFPQSVVDNYYVKTSNGLLDANNMVYAFNGIDIVLTSKTTGVATYFTLETQNTEALPPVSYSFTNESCMGSGDASITIANQDPNLIYSLYNVNTEINYANPINGGWSGLTKGIYSIYATNNTNVACKTSEQVEIQVNSPVTIAITTNQCSAQSNGVVSFSTTVNNQPVNNVVYSVDVQINSTKVILPSGDYTVKAFVNEGTCRQFVNQDFTVQSNILEAEVVSSICSTASIKATSELQDQLTIRLYNVTNGGNSLVGQAINGNTANITNLSRGTYQFTITESSGCSITTASFNILECPTQPPTETPTQTPINRSYQLSPYTSLLFFSILSLIFFA